MKNSHQEKLLDAENDANFMKNCAIFRLRGISGAE